MEITEIEKLVEQSQREFVRSLVNVNLLDRRDHQGEFVVVMFLRRYTEDIIDILKLLIEGYQAENVSPDEDAKKAMLDKLMEGCGIDDDHRV